MAEKKSQKETEWVNEAAREQVEPLLKHQLDWQGRKKARQLEQVLILLSELYPADANKIHLSLRGETVTAKPVIKTRMKVVSSHVSAVKKGCTDCGDQVTVASKSFAELKTDSDVMTYFNVSTDKALALHRMKELLKANGKNAPTSMNPRTVAKKILELIEGGNFMY